MGESAVNTVRSRVRLTGWLTVSETVLENVRVHGMQKSSLARSPKKSSSLGIKDIINGARDTADKPTYLRPAGNAQR